MSNQKIGILYVDDELLSLKYFKEIFQEKAAIFIADTPEKGIELFIENQNQIGVVLSDKTMPGMSGLDFLKKIEEINPEPLRILVTAFKDLSEAVDSLNSGLLHSYLSKPWKPEDMQIKIQKSLDLFWIKQQKAQLLRDRSTMFREMMMAEKVSNIETLSIGFSQNVTKSIGAIRSYFDNIPSQLNQELAGKPPEDNFFWSEYYSSVCKQIERIESIFAGLSGCITLNQPDSTLSIEPDIILANLISEVGSAETSKFHDINFVVRGELEYKIEGDPVKLLRMFSNLFRESIISMGEQKRGEISIIIEDELHTDGSEGVSVFFNDDAELLNEKQRQHLFDPFYLKTDRTSGQNPNMLACYIIAYLHGGHIATDFDPDAPRNSIHLWLPRVNRQPAQAELSRKFLDSLI